MQAAPYQQERLKAWCPPEGTSQIILRLADICALISQAERQDFGWAWGTVGSCRGEFQVIGGEIDIPVLLTECFGFASLITQ